MMRHEKGEVNDGIASIWIRQRVAGGGADGGSVRGQESISGADAAGGSHGGGSDTPNSLGVSSSA